MCIRDSFEGVPGADESALTAFAGHLSTALRAAGAGLSIDVVPHTLAGTNSASAAYDDPGLAAVADYLVVMAYDESTQVGEPGPVAGIDWQAAELDGTMPGVPAAKIVLDVYKRQGTIRAPWPTPSPSTPVRRSPPWARRRSPLTTTTSAWCRGTRPAFPIARTRVRR